MLQLWKKNLKQNIAGFTLLEFIVVIAILGILGTIALPMYTKATARKKGQAVINKIRIIIAAEKIYYINNHEYWPPANGAYNCSEINAALNINIIENNFGWDNIGEFWMSKPNPPGTPLQEIWSAVLWTGETRDDAFKMFPAWDTLSGTIGWDSQDPPGPYWFEEYPETLPDN